MKLLTKEEEDAHYRAVVKGGSIGTVLGLIGGVVGVLAGSRRYPTIRNLTVPMKAFLVTSSGTFVGIVAADHASRNFELTRNAQLRWYQDREHQVRETELSGMSASQRLLDWARREKYKIVGATWLASMIGSFVLVGRNPYLTGQQKIVQARVYAQGLTLAVLVASAGFEISDQRKGRGILDATKSKEARMRQSDPLERTSLGEPNEEVDMWKDMVAAEEQRLKAKHQSLYDHHDHENGQKDSTARITNHEAKKQLVAQASEDEV